MSDEAPQRFDYTPRRVTLVGRGYSQFVSILKFALPVGALIIVGVLIVRLSGGGMPQQDLTALPPTEKTTPGQVELIQAKYEGVDDQGRPYTVTADKATRAVSAPDTVFFENPVADIMLADDVTPENKKLSAPKGGSLNAPKGAWVAVKGSSGSIDHKTEIMTLKDNVAVFHDSGYEMHLKDLEINLKEKSARTSLPVEAQGPMGTITAQNMLVTDQGNMITFGGPASITFFKLTSSKKARG